VHEKGLPPGTTLNVNVPAVPEEELRGVRVTRQGRSTWDDFFDVRRDPGNREYFWLTGRMNVIDKDPETDQVAVQEKVISITPIQYNLTDAKQVEQMRDWGVEGLLRR